jgi:hypothetical protein
MTIATTKMRLFNRATCLVTVGGYLDTLLKPGANGSPNLRPELKVLARIGTEYSRHRAGFTKIRSPGLTGHFQEPAFFHVSSAKVISVKIAAFKSSGCFHEGWPSFIERILPLK